MMETVGHLARLDADGRDRAGTGKAWLSVVRLRDGLARQGMDFGQRKSEMSKPRRQPPEIWQETRQRIWQRDQGRCQGPYCQSCPPWSLSLQSAQIDHIIEVCRGGSNSDPNLRTLCRRCHCLRANHTHQGMIAPALRDEIIPPNWRSLVWEG
jgi:hypothetical protein